MAWKWLESFGRGAKSAAPLALLFVPEPYQLLAQTVYSAVLQAERTQGTGAQKLAAAMRDVDWAMPFLLKEVERITGRRVVDVAALRQALSKLAEFQVLITKSIGENPQ